MITESVMQYKIYYNYTNGGERKMKKILSTTMMMSMLALVIQFPDVAAIRANAQATRDAILTQATQQRAAVITQVNQQHQDVLDQINALLGL